MLNKVQTRVSQADLQQILEAADNYTFIQIVSLPESNRCLLKFYQETELPLLVEIAAS